MPAKLRDPELEEHFTLEDCTGPEYAKYEGVVFIRAVCKHCNQQKPSTWAVPVGEMGEIAMRDRNALMAHYNEGHLRAGVRMRRIK